MKNLLICVPLVFLSACTCASYSIQTPDEKLMSAAYCSTKEFEKVDIKHGDVRIRVDGVQNNLVPDVAGAVTRGAVSGAVGGALKHKALEKLTQ